jgi:membrane protease YdiL (CAAX protease family)
LTERSNARLAGWIALVGAVAALGYAARASGSKTPHDAVYHYDTAVNEIGFFLVILAVVLGIAAGADRRRLFALRRPRSWRRALWIALGVLVAVWILNAGLNPLLHPGREQGLAPSGWKTGHAGAFAANVVAFALVGPVVEELTFRGLGFSLLERFGRTAAVLLVGVAFGLWHGLVEALPILVALGIGLAYLRARTGSLYPGLLLHVGFNALALGLAVAP